MAQASNDAELASKYQQKTDKGHILDTQTLTLALLRKLTLLCGYYLKMDLNL